MSIPGERIILFLALILSGTVYVSGQVDFSVSNLPVVVIETNGQEILDDPRIVADMGIIYNGEGQDNHISDPFNHYEGKISIEYRGSTSLNYAKKSYSFETQDDYGANRNVPLLGMPEENDWVLYGPYGDKTLIRNIISYKLFSDLGHYAPRTSLCELVLNGNYQGVYVLVEKIKRDGNRVNIAGLNSSDISGDNLTGGYIIKIDKTNGDVGPTWTTGDPGWSVASIFQIRINPFEQNFEGIYMSN